jgi:hypothetical protein
MSFKCGIAKKVDLLKKVLLNKKKLHFCFSLVITFAMFPAYSNQLKESIALIIKPKLCVLNNERQSCKDKIIISWTSSKAESICLYSSQQAESLACWSQSWSGETEQLIKTQDSLQFSLKEKERVVAQKKLQVLKNFARRNKRSRKRHPWSIF